MKFSRILILGFLLVFSSARAAEIAPYEFGFRLSSFKDQSGKQRYDSNFYHWEVTDALLVATLKKTGRAPSDQILSSFERMSNLKYIGDRTEVTGEKISLLVAKDASVLLSTVTIGSLEKSGCRSTMKDVSKLLFQGAGEFDPHAFLVVKDSQTDTYAVITVISHTDYAEDFLYQGKLWISADGSNDFSKLCGASR